MSLIHLLGRGFGRVTPPATPTLTAADIGDGTGAVATIAGSTAGSINQVYTVPASGGSWTLAGTRTGDGSLSLLLTPGVYFGYVVSTRNGAAALSAVATIRVAAATTDDCPPIRVAAAVAAEINAAAADGSLTKSFTAVFSFASEITKLESVNASDGLTVDVLPHMTPDWSARSATVARHDCRVIVGIRRRIEATDRAADGAILTAEIAAYANLLYQILTLFAMGRELTDLSAAVWNPQAKPEICLYDEKQLKSGLYVGWIYLPFVYHETP